MYNPLQGSALGRVKAKRDVGAERKNEAEKGERCEECVCVSACVCVCVEEASVGGFECGRKNKGEKLETC